MAWTVSLADLWIFMQKAAETQFQASGLLSADDTLKALAWSVLLVPFQVIYSPPCKDTRSQKHWS
jgi:hypothetical protein